MSFLEYRVKTAPIGIAKVLHLNWGLVLAVTAVAAIGWLMLYSIAGGDLQTWAAPQMKRFGMGLVLMFAIAFTPIWFWRSMSGLGYGLYVCQAIAVAHGGDLAYTYEDPFVTMTTRLPLVLP